MNNTERNTGDQHTITDWPIEIQNIKDIPSDFQNQVITALKDDVLDYILIYAPAYSGTSPYLFAYGNNTIFYFYKEKDSIKQTSDNDKRTFKLESRFKKRLFAIID